MKWSLLLVFFVTITFAQDATKPQPPAEVKALPPAEAKALPAAPAEVKPYKAPALSSEDSWMMVVVPDVQAYTERPRNHGIVELMNGWIVDNVLNLKIQQVLFTGDLVFRNDQMYPYPLSHPEESKKMGMYGGMNSLCSREQWKAFSRMMERLDGQVPYVLCTGNHDYGNVSAENRNTYYNDYFPTDRNPLSRRQLIGAGYNSERRATLECAIYEFKAPSPDNRMFLIITLPFAPTDKDLAWAKKVVDEPRFQNHIGIVLTHSYLRRTGERLQEEKYALSKAGGNPGEGIFQKLVYPAKNIRLVICGHIAAADQWEAGVVFSMDKNSSGKSVAQMAFNTQAITGWHGNGGDGWLRLLEFMPDRKTVKATTFSPLFAISPSTQHLAWRHDPICEFTFTIDE